MKKLRALITLIVLSVFLCISSLPVSAAVLVDNYIYLDDRGLYDHSENNERYHSKTYGYYLDTNNNLYFIGRGGQEIMFTFNNNIPDAENQIIEIFKKSFPVNNFNSDDSSVPKYYKDEYEDGVIRGIIIDYSTPKETLPKIRDELVEKNLVEKLYDIGETGSAFRILSANYEGKFMNVYFAGSLYSNDYDTELSPEIVQQYIDDNSLNCTLTQEIPEGVTYPYPPKSFYLVPDKDLTKQETFELALELIEEFGIYPMYIQPEFALDLWLGADYCQTISAPSLDFGSITIAGDIDLNNEQGISDIVTLSKYNSNPELYPITDPTALANADMNGDKYVDSRDTAMLVIMALGTYESAV